MTHLALAVLLLADPRALFEQALTAQKQGRLADAVKLLEQAAQAAPKNFAIFGNLGAIRAQLGDHAGALQAYRQALALNPAAARLHLNIGLAHFRAGQFSDALAALEQFLRAEPGNAQARELRALCLLQLGRYTESAAAYAELGDELAPLYGLGQSLLKSGDRAGAERAFDRMFARHGATPQAELLQAQMLMAENRLEEALAKLDSLKGAASLRGVELWRGITLEGLGRLADARNAYRTEFEASGDLVAAYALGVLAGRDGAEREALDWLTRAQPLDGQQYNVSYHRGRALLRLGRTTESVPLLEASARRNPESVPERYLLLQAYQKLRRAADAQRVSAEIRRLRDTELQKDRGKLERAGEAPPRPD